jgi:serine/threonine protein kinase
MEMSDGTGAPGQWWQEEEPEPPATWSSQPIYPPPPEPPPETVPPPVTPDVTSEPRASVPFDRAPSAPPSSQFELRVGPDNDPDRYGYGQIRGAGAEGELHHGVQFSDLVGVDLEVAIKEARGDDAALEQLASRWSDQAAVLNRIAHPGIVRVHAAFLGAPPHWTGTVPPPGRRFYLVMNWVSGENLRVWRESQPALSTRQALGPLVQVAAALDVLHSGADTGRPLVHGDVKPENVVMHPANGPVLVDFGLVRAEGVAAPSQAGSGGYRAPEVLTSGAWSAASDRYAVGAIGYFLLTGVDLEEHPNLAEVRTRLLALPHLAGQDPVVDALIAMLHPDPAARPPSATPWVQSMIGTMSTTMGQTVVTQPVSISALAPAAPKRRRARWPVVAAVVALLLAGAGAAGAVALRHDERSGGTASTASTTTRPDPTTTSEEATTSTSSTSTTSSPSTTTTTVVSGTGSDYLNDLQVVEGNEPSTATLAINGITYTRAVSSEVCRAGGSDAVRSWSYDLGRAKRRFTGVLGLDDSSPAGAQVQVRISLDGVDQPLLSPALGKPATLDIDVSNVLRLAIRTERIDRDNPCATIAIGDGKLES